jgi:protein-disulfide isomerase
MRSRFETVATAVVVLAAVLVAGAAVHRELSPASTARRVVVDPSGPPTYIQDWEDWRKDGILVGAHSAPITLVEFADYECPFCQRFHGDYLKAKAHYGDSLAFLFLHYPIQRHRFALPAARVAECSHAQGRFEAVHDLLFQKQDSFGLKPWVTFATEVGIPDSAGFGRCIEEIAPIPRVEAGLRRAEQVGVQGTPTVVINGWRFATAPYDTLVEAIANLLAGKPPYTRGR